MIAKTIMVQGTASSAGKSMLVTALCRILRQDGYRVAPFKSQNMALNSFVTSTGGEIGRAQAVQAEAAGIEPTVEMNPILLKPEAEASSQVIVLGKPLMTLPARQYYHYKTLLLGVVEEALTKLRAQYDIIVIEGAGSPAEVNLKQDEIVNMRVAKMAGAPVLLVGDIDRGGVFASLVGTLELLDPDEREIVKGLVINKFRGDITLLKSGLDFLERRTGKPVVGVVPYFRHISIAQEDSVYLETRSNLSSGPRPLDVAVIRLPRISNFDDFDPLEHEPDVSVRYVEGTRDLGRPDLMILPGTKSTLADLAHLHEIGLTERIVELAVAGTPLIGICGGYQMLGRRISDPLHVESSVEEVDGMGLLDVETVFASKKTTTQVAAVVVGTIGLLADATGLSVTGYEIHSGQTSGSPALPALRVIARTASDGTAEDYLDGGTNEAGTVLGTYLHGLFHNMALRRSLLNGLRRQKGLPLVESLSEGLAFDKDREYDKLADLVRNNMEMEAVYRMIGLR